MWHLQISSVLFYCQGAGELFGAAAMSMKRAGMIASLVLMLFLLTGGYYVQVSMLLQIKVSITHIPGFMVRVLKRRFSTQYKINECLHLVL